MANSKFILTFLAMPAVNDEIHIGETTLGLDIKEIFKANRLGLFQTKIPALFDASTEEEEIFVYGGYISENYKNAFNLDHNSTGLFTITVENDTPATGLGVVTVEANYPGAVFVDNNTLPEIMSVEIINEEVATPINITDVSYEEAGDTPCQNVTVSVETDVLATKILSPISVDPNTDNPFTFDGLRGQTVTLTVENAEGSQASQIITLPAILNLNNFTINVNSGPNGGTAVVTNVNSDGLVLEYSLDGITWQTSSTFPGLDVGDYTLYVRDQLGCSFTKAFTVNEFGIYNPYFYISKANSFRWANRITWGDSANYKTDENTLSCEVDVAPGTGLAYKEIQQFQSADIPPTQFRSNYATNTAKIIRPGEDDVNLTVVKKTNNIGIKDKRDARMYNLGGGRTGVYFVSGNTYDFNTDVANGTYALNGLVPEWAQTGNYITIDGAWYLIEEVAFDETVNADVIIFSNTYTGPEVNIIAGSIFNRFNYEVYEFLVDMVDYIDQKFRVKLECSDPHFDTITQLTELIWCKVKHERVLEIKYRNTTNTDVFYATGIEFIIRIPYLLFKGKAPEESDTYKTDTDAILLDAELYEGDEIQFEPVTKEIWRKIMIALSHEKVTINGVGYVKNGEFGTEGPLEKSNLYLLTANMIKTANVYNSQTSGNVDFDGTAVEVPGLIQTDSGFLEY